MTKDAVTTQSGEAFPHRELWSCAELHYKQATSVERGRFYFDLTAVLMAYLTYEAYVNFAGDRVDPDAWNDDKRFFNKAPYYGLEGKLTRIQEKCGNFTVDKSVRPYQTIKRLEAFRSEVVHAKVYKYEQKKEHPSDVDPDMWPERCFKYVNKKTVGIVMEDVEKFIEYLHQEIKPYVKDVWFQAYALQGTRGYASGSTELKR